MKIEKPLWDWNPDHPPDDVMERYVMGRATELEVEQLEEHILLCRACRDALDVSTAWVPLMKSALTATESTQTPLCKETPSSDWSWAAQFRSPLWVGAAAFAGLIVALQLTDRHADTPAQEVVLAAVRGSELYKEIKPHAPLDLIFENASGRRAAIVRASDGAVVWKGMVGDSRARAPALVTGAYWVRLFDAWGAQTQEYGLRVQ